jgi:hypothetical protein
MKLLPAYDIWAFVAFSGYKIVVPTNGVVTSDGRAVMGAGMAKQAAQRYPALPKLLGTLITEAGNQVYEFSDIPVVAFPTKHHWKDKSDLALIAKSVESLVNLASSIPGRHTTYVMPKVGCGLGGRTWEEVEPLLQVLPDNVWVVIG